MIKHQFVTIWNDIKYSFIDLWNGIHNFLNRFFDDTFLGLVGIALIAISAVFIFVKLQNKQ